MVTPHRKDDTWVCCWSQFWSHCTVYLLSHTHITFGDCWSVKASFLECWSCCRLYYWIHNQLRRRPWLSELENSYCISNFNLHNSSNTSLNSVTIWNSFEQNAKQKDRDDVKALFQNLLKLRSVIFIESFIQSSKIRWFCFVPFIEPWEINGEYFIGIEKKC